MEAQEEEVKCLYQQKREGKWKWKVSIVEMEHVVPGVAAVAQQQNAGDQFALL